MVLVDKNPTAGTTDMGELFRTWGVQQLKGSTATMVTQATGDPLGIFLGGIVSLGSLGKPLNLSVAQSSYPSDEIGNILGL